MFVDCLRFSKETVTSGLSWKLYIRFASVGHWQPSFLEVCCIIFCYFITILWSNECTAKGGFQPEIMNQRSHLS